MTEFQQVLNLLALIDSRLKDMTLSQQALYIERNGLRGALSKTIQELEVYKNELTRVTSERDRLKSLLTIYIQELNDQDDL